MDFAMMQPNGSLRVAVGIATRGRAAVLGDVILRLRNQKRRPDRFIVCYTEPADVAGLEHLEGVEWVLSPAGLVLQRNAILKLIYDFDIVIFFDDDFLAAPDYLRVVEESMARDSTIAVATGHVIADGVKGPGYSVAEGLAFLAQDRDPMSNAMASTAHAYGCNMVLRLSVLREHNIWFDENLPLYGWYEDVDLSRRAGEFGSIVKFFGARGVHLGTKMGRTSGLRLGYSQIANPIYIARKGKYSWLEALLSISRNFAANLTKSLLPAGRIDRRGRLLGNVKAIYDLLAGKLHPANIVGF